MEGGRKGKSKKRGKGRQGKIGGVSTASSFD